MSDSFSVLWERQWKYKNDHKKDILEYWNYYNNVKMENII